MVSSWESLGIALDAGGHRLNASKTNLYLPCWDNISFESMPASLQVLVSQVRRAKGGISTMGCAAQGSFEGFLGPFQLASQPARVRLQKASVFCDEICKFLNMSSDECRYHVAWQLITKSSNQTLSYDARLLPPSAIGCVLNNLGSMARSAVEHVACMHLPKQAWL